MIAEAVRRRIPFGWTGDPGSTPGASLRTLVDGLADRHLLFEASEAQRDAIARRAAAFLARKPLGRDERHDLALDLAGPEWHVRARAAGSLTAREAWMPWTVTGSLAAEDGAAPADLPDDARLAAAITVAARETLTPGLQAAFSRLEPAAVALAHEKDGESVWDAACRPLVDIFAANTRACGSDRRAAALRALTAAAHLKGRALSAAKSHGRENPRQAAMPFLLGAASGVLLRKDQAADESPHAAALKDLAEMTASLNDARAALWDGADPEATRLLGAAAAVAAFGRGCVTMPKTHVREPLTRHDITWPPAWLGRLGHLTASSAAEALDEEASDPRREATYRRVAELLAERLQRHPAPQTVSFAEALGMDPPEIRSSEPRPWMRLFRAAPAFAKASPAAEAMGDRPAGKQQGVMRRFVCAGKRGRPVRCHAVADADGSLVGYLAFDAMSREFGGRPLSAIYALDGRRWGYAWADEPWVARRGDPGQAFRTAPERIPL